MTDAAPWARDPIDFGARGVMMPPSAPADGDSGDRPLIIRPRARGAVPPPAAPPSDLQSSAAGPTPSPASAAPSPVPAQDATASATPWENDPVDSSPSGDATAALGRGLINGVPIIGPALAGGVDRVVAGIRSLKNSTNYDDELKATKDFDQQTDANNPTASTAGQMAGAVLSTIPLAAAAPVAFGAEGATMLGRMGIGAATNAAIGGADAGMRSDGDPNAMAGGAALGGLGGAVGGALGRAGGQAVAQPFTSPVIDAADRLGITVPKAVASDSRMVQAAGAGIRNVPFAGEPLMQASESTLRQIGQTADNLAAGVGNAGPENAGRSIQGAAQRQVDSAAADQAAYQGSMGQQAATATAGTNPLAVGADVRDRIGQFGQRVADREAAPGQQLASDVGDLAGRLGPADRVGAGQDVTQGLTRYAQDTLPAQQEAAYNAALGSIPQNARTPLTATRDAAADIMGARSAASLPDNVGGAVGMVSQAIRNPAGFTVQGIQTLRSTVGELLKRPTLETSMNRAELQRVYGALSDDLGNAVRTHGGPEAAAAFDQANALTRTGRQAVARANRVAQQPPERALGSVIGMAGTGAGGDASRLASIRGMVGDEGFSSVPAAALSKLSTDASGQLSPATFARNVHGMTPEGRAALFGDHAGDVQSLATRAAMLAQMPADAERPLADALARIGRGSAEHVLSNVFAMASSGGRADVQQLAKLRGVIGEQAWGRVGSALLRRAAFDPANGAFNPDGLVKFAGNLTPQTRMMMFGDGPGRQALDAARTMADQPFNAAKIEAEGLKRSLGQSDEGAFARIAAMASSGSRADATQLARLRSTMTKEEWADVGATVIKGLGRDVQGNFSPDRYITGWSKLSEAGKGMLFPDATLRRSLDDIATVSSRFKELNKYANPSGTARNTAFHVGALGALWADPITTVSSLVGANVLSRILASPATAKSMATWSRAYELAVTTPTEGTRIGLMVASRGLGTTVSEKLGVRLPVDDLLHHLPQAVPAKSQHDDRRGVGDQ